MLFVHIVPVRPRLRRAVPAAFLLGVAAAAVGMGVARAQQPPAQLPAAAPVAAASVAPAPLAGGPTPVRITAREYAFDAPASLPTGITSFVMDNVGAEEHLGAFVRLNEGVTMDQFTVALQNPDPTTAFGLVSFQGGPGDTEPGTTSNEVTLNLNAGQYLLLCFISDEEDGVPHFAKGMIQPVTVAPPPSSAVAPQESATVTARDFSFQASPISAGRQTLRLVNQGAQPHELGIFRTGVPVTREQVIAAVQSEEEGPPPFPTENVPGLEVISPGVTGWVTVDVTPGTYVLVCFVPDPGSGQPHAALGMVEVITVP